MILTINSLTEKPVAGSLNIMDTTRRSTATMKVDSNNSISVGQEVQISDGGVIFGGTIDSYSLSYLRGGTDGTRKRYAIKCVDYNQTCDRLRVAETYENETVGDIVSDLVSTYLSAEGITLGTVALSTTVVAKAVFNYVSVADAFDFIVTAVPSLNWNIDYSKELTFYQRADNNGSDFTDANCLEMMLKETRRQYANRVYLRAGDSTTEVQTKESTSPKPDGVSRVFSVRFPIAKKPTIYVNDTDVGGANVGILGLDTGKEWYWQKDSNEIVQDETETVLSTSDTLTVSYQGLKPILVAADNPSEQANRGAIENNTGVYEILESKTDLDDKGAAVEYANGVVERRGTIPRTIMINSDTVRSAGQLINVKSDNLGVNEDFLITDVKIFDVNGCQLRYIINGASGADLGGWVEFYRSLKTGETVSIKENEVLVKLQTLSETLQNQGSYVIKTFTPLYPSNTLYPSETLYPNGNALSEVTVND